MKKFFEHYGFGILAVVAITVLLFCIPPVRNTIFNTANGLINRFRGTAVEKVDKIDGLQYGAILTNNRAVLNVESTTDKFDTKIHYIYNGIEYVVDGKQLDAAGSNSIIVDDILVSKDDVLLYPDMNSKYYVEFINQGTGEIIVSDKEKFKGRDTIINEDTFNLVFNSNGGSDVSTLNTSRVPLSLPKPTRAGYKFSGWYTDALLTNPAVSGTKLTADTTLYAKWTNTSHTVSFNSNGGSAVTSMTVGEGNQFGTLPTPTKTGYTFVGWYNSSGAKISSTSVMGNADITLNARWTEKNIRYDIVYKSLSGIQLGSGTQTEKFNTSKVVVPGNIVGYTTPASQTVVWDTEATKTITFTYTPITYNIHYNLDGGSLENAKGTYNVEDVFTIGTPHKDGYEFAGWFDNSLLTGTAITKISQATGNKTLYAKWESLNYYWGIDGSNKLIISDKEVTTATGGRSGSFSKTANYLDDDPPWYPFASDITSAEVVKVNKKIAPVSTSSWFAELENATSIDVSNLDTSNVTDMVGMFAGAGYNATTFTITGLESWNTSNVTDMSWMFVATGYSAKTWSIGNLSGWDTSKVTNMASMFSGAGRNATSWSVGNISNWNTSNVTSMANMFSFAGQNAITELDLSGWDATNVTTMEMMFNGINSLETIKTPKNIQAGTVITNITGKTFYDITDGGTEYPAGTFPTGNGDVSHTLKVKEYYWGIDSTNKLIISDEPVATATGGRSGSFDPNDTFNCTGTGLSSVTTAPWGIYADVITNIEIAKVSAYIAPTSTEAWFAGLKNAKTVNVTQLDTSNVINMSNMFLYTGCNADSFSIIGTDTWDTGNVTNMSHMFCHTGESATSWYISDISKWNTSKVINMSGLFMYAAGFANEFNIGNLSTKEVTVNGDTYTAWNTANVVNMDAMFSNAGYNATTWSIGNISNWDTSKVTNMSYLFNNANSSGGAIKELDLSGWNASKVTDMSWMFNGISSLETIKTPKNIQASTKLTYILSSSKIFYDINDGNTEYTAGTFPTGNTESHTLTSIDPNYYWGIDASNKLIISDRPVTTATDNRAGRFSKTMALTGSSDQPWYSHRNDITSIEVIGHVAPVSTACWFQGLGNITSIDVSNLDTSNVTDMQSMFWNAGLNTTSFTITGMENWNTSKVTDMSYMFEWAGRDATTWSIGDLSNWNTSNVTDMSYMFYNAGQNATMWNIGDLRNWNTSKVTNMANMFDNAGYEAESWSIGDLSNWDTSKVTNMANMFDNAGYNATTFDIGDLNTKTVIASNNTYTAWNTASVTDMSGMFDSAGYNATTWSIGDISNWNTSKVISMTSMFLYAGYNTATFNIGDLSTKTVTVGGNTYTAWNTSNVASMSYMFDSVGYNATTWSIGDIGNWNTGKVTGMNLMFLNAGYNATTWTVGDLSTKTVTVGGNTYTAWDTGNVTGMYRMFYSAGSNATTWSIGNISNWDTSKVTNMNALFSDAGRNAITELDLSGWDATNVTNMAGMFYGISSLETIKTPKNIQTGTNITNITTKTFYDITDGGTEYPAGTFPVNKAESHTLSVSIPTHNVTLHYEDGITPDEIVQVITVDQLPIPTREGYVFDGWWNGIASVNEEITTVQNGFSGMAEWIYNSENKAWYSNGERSAIAFEFTPLVDTKINFDVYINAGTTDVLDYILTDPEFNNIYYENILMGDTTDYGSVINSEVIGSITGWQHVTLNVEAGIEYNLIFGYFKDDTSPAVGLDAGFVKNINIVSAPATYTTLVEGTITSDCDVIANWAPITYTINYVLNGGTLAEGAVTTYTIEDEVMLPDATKEGYVLEGWYETEDLTGDSIDVILLNTTGNKTYYAKWQDAYYWGIDASNQLIISDEPVTTATSNRAGSFAKNAVFSESTQPWKTYAKDITSVNVNRINKDIAPISTEKWFYGLTNTTIINVTDLTTSDTTNMYGMFQQAGLNASSFKITGMDNWDTSKVTDMSHMFGQTGQNSTTFEIGDISNWNTSKVTNMRAMFNYAGSKATSISLDLSGWDACNVTDMSYMFRGLTNLSEIKTPKNIQSSVKLTEITSKTFYDITDNDREYAAGAFPTGNGDVSHTLTSIEPSYYWGIDSTNKLIISDAPVASATENRAGSFAKTLSISIFSQQPWYSYKDVVTSVEVMKVNKNIAPISTRNWFYDLKNVTKIDVSQLDTSKVTDMNSMFSNAGNTATTFEIIGLETWNTSNVTNMGYMFAYTDNDTFKELDLSSWDASKVTNMSRMFYTKSLETIKTPKNIKSSVTLTDITRKTFWDATDNDKEYSAGTFPTGNGSTNHTLTTVGHLYYWGIDATNKLIISDQPVATATSSRAGNFVKTATFSGSYSGTSIVTTAPWGTYANTITSIEVIKVNEKVAPISTASWFRGLTQAKTIDLSQLDISNVTNMSYMFEDTGSNVSTFTITGLDNWDTSNVTNMNSVFCYAGQNATTWSIGDLSNWNTSKVTNMSNMFYLSGFRATTFDVGDLSTKTVTVNGNTYTAWDVSKVTDMRGMFFETGAESTVTWSIGDLGNWNTGNVTNMSGMFENAGRNVKDWSIGDIGKWNTSKVTDMHQMFNAAGFNATNWNIGDLSTKTVTVNGDTYTAWDVSKVTNMRYMFESAGPNATTWSIGDIGNWNTSKVTDMKNMFRDAGESATTWTIGNISNWDTSNVTNMSEMFRWAGRNAITELDLSGWDATNVTDMSGMFYGINSLETIKTPKNIQNSATVSSITSKTFWDATDNYTEYPANNFPKGNTESHTLVADLNIYWGVDETNKLIISDKAVTTATGGRSGSFAGTDTFDFETDHFTPWFDYANDITSIEIVKVNRKVMPINTAFWFAGLENVVNVGVTNLDTSNVTDMSYMFCNAGANATTFNITGLDSWNTSKVTDMLMMFYGAGHSATTWSIGNISNWNTSNVTNMSMTFFGAGSNALIELDLSGWDASNVADMSMMLHSIDSLETIKTPKNIQNGVTLTGITSKTFYDTTDNNAEYTAGSFPVGNAESHTLVSDTDIYWRVDGNKLTISDKPIDDVMTYIVMPYGSFAATETFNPTAGNPAPWYDFRESITSVEVVEVNKKIAPVSTAYWFARMYNVETVDLSNLDAANVTSMSFMFDNTNARIIKTPINIRSDLNTESILSAVYRDITDNNIEYDNLSFPIGNGNVSHTLEFVEGINN